MKNYLQYIYIYIYTCIHIYLYIYIYFFIMINKYIISVSKDCNIYKEILHSLSD